MEPVQLILVTLGLALGLGGVAWIFRSASRGESARAGYLPLAMVVVGLVIAYRSFSSFPSLDTQDITIMFLFVIGLLGLLGLQFFVVEKNNRKLDGPADGAGTPDVEER